QLWADAGALLAKGRACFVETRLQGALTGLQRRQVQELNLESGKLYVFILQSRAFEPQARLEDGAGHALAVRATASATEARAVFPPPRGDRSRIRVGSRNDHGVGEYTLLIRAFAVPPR